MQDVRKSDFWYFVFCEDCDVLAYVFNEEKRKGKASLCLDGTVKDIFLLGSTLFRVAERLLLPGTVPTIVPSCFMLSEPASLSGV